MHLLCINHGLSLIRGSAPTLLLAVSSVSLQTQLQCSYSISQRPAPAGWLLTQHSNRESIPRLNSPHTAAEGRCCSSGINLVSHGHLRARRQGFVRAWSRTAFKSRVTWAKRPGGYLFTHKSFSCFRSSGSSWAEGTSWTCSRQPADGETLCCWAQTGRGVLGFTCLWRTQAVLVCDCSLLPVSIPIAV